MCIWYTNDAGISYRHDASCPCFDPLQVHLYPSAPPYLDDKLAYQVAVFLFYLTYYLGGGDHSRQTQKNASHSTGNSASCCDLSKSLRASSCCDLSKACEPATSFQDLENDWNALLSVLLRISQGGFK